LDSPHSRRSPWLFRDGACNGSQDFIVNPVFDTALHQHNCRTDFAPCARYTHELTAAWKVGIERYADVGPLDGSYPEHRQAQMAYAIMEWSYRSIDVDFGIGHRWTPAPDETIAKAIVGFPL
jgi:hypothetical protein